MIRRRSGFLISKRYLEPAGHIYYALLCLCKHSFTGLVKQYLNHGHVESSDFEKLGFRINNDPGGKQARQGAFYAQELIKRAESLTHTHQRKLRKLVKDVVGPKLR